MLGGLNMPKKIDTKKIEECIREILIALGDDPIEKDY